MPEIIAPLKYPAVTSDPASPSDGQRWYRSDLKQHRCRIGSSTVPLGPDLLSVPIMLGGPIVVATGIIQVPVPFDCVFESFMLRLATVPTGATTFKMDVNYDGTSIYNTNQGNRPIWAASANIATYSTPDTVSFAGGGTHYWSWDIDAIGSTIGGSNLAGWMMVRRTAV